MIFFQFHPLASLRAITMLVCVALWSPPEALANKPATPSKNTKASPRAPAKAPPRAKAPARPKAPTRPGAAAAATQPKDLTDLAAWCNTIAPRLSGMPLSQCLNSGLAPGEGRSVRGVPLWLRDVAPPEGTASLRVFVLGGIHGDEPTSVNVVFDWLESAGKSQDSVIHWRMVPLGNPDGLLRRPSTRTNSRGVDLNRNFPTDDWSRDAHAYWAKRTGKDPRRYPGPAAMSEPETQWIQGQIEQFKPQLIVAIHAPYGLLDFDGPAPPPNRLGSLYLDQIGIYPGSLGNYGGTMERVPVITVELKNARQVSRNEIQAIWRDLLKWIDRRLLPSMAAQVSPATPAAPTTPTVPAMPAVLLNSGGLDSL
jgi:murein peptide amidase A